MYVCGLIFIRTTYVMCVQCNLHNLLEVPIKILVMVMVTFIKDDLKFKASYIARVSKNFKLVLKILYNIEMLSLHLSTFITCHNDNCGLCVLIDTKHAEDESCVVYDH